MYYLCLFPSISSTLSHAFSDIDLDDLFDDDDRDAVASKKKKKKKKSNNNENKQKVQEGQTKTRAESSVVFTYFDNHDAEALTTKVLFCVNCEDNEVEIKKWCHDCGDDNDEDPDADMPVYCEDCEAGLHTGKRTRHHTRKKFSYESKVIEVGQTLECVGLPNIKIPAGFPEVRLILCDFCDEPAEAWCSQCAEILCQECSDEAHAPKSKASHIAHVLKKKLLLSGNGIYKEFKTTTTMNHDVLNALRNNLSSDDDDSDDNNNFNSNMSSGSKYGAGKGSQSMKVKKPSEMTKAKSNKSMGADPDADASTNVEDFMLQFEMARMSKAEKAASSVGGALTDRSSIHGGAAIEEFPSKTFGEGMIITTKDLGYDEVELEEHEFKNTFNMFDKIGDVQLSYVTCGRDHTAALTKGGTLFLWGLNRDGQLGYNTGSEGESKAPQVLQFPDDEMIADVACGYVHSIALTKSGDVYTWGSGIMGILGHPSDADSPTPKKVYFGKNRDLNERVVYVGCGQNNTGVIVHGRADGKQMYLWGEGADGQLGMGPDNMYPSLTPQLTSCGLEKKGVDPNQKALISLDFGQRHCVCVCKDGTVYSFGDNQFGQLGFNSSSNDDRCPTPSLVAALAIYGLQAVQVSCGEILTSVRCSNGQVWSWGSGETHQMGIVDNVEQFLPVMSVGLGTEQTRVVDLYVGQAVTTATTDSGDVYMWGIGSGSPTPKVITGLQGQYIQRVTQGDGENTAILTGASQAIYSWQFQEDHNGAVQPRPVPNEALRGKRLISISVGKMHSGAVTNDGRMLMWGWNREKQLGLGLDQETAQPFVPMPIEVSVPVKLTLVLCSEEHSLALSTEGKVLAWGTGGAGRLGHETNQDIPEPKLIDALASVVATSISIGPANSACITKDGDLWCWGSNAMGQCGNNKTTPTFQPELVVTLKAKHEKVVQHAFGGQHSCCVTKDGMVYTWGDNRFGQLGHGEDEEEQSILLPTPVMSPFLTFSTVLSVACGDNVSFCLTESGKVFGWGSAETAQLLTGDYYDRPSPIAITFPDDPMDGSEVKIVKILSTNINTVAVTDKGHLYVWGYGIEVEGHDVETHPALVESLLDDDVAVSDVALGHNAILLLGQ